jgi:hypothetical protein
MAMSAPWHTPPLSIIVVFGLKHRFAEIGAGLGSAPIPEAIYTNVYPSPPVIRLLKMSGPKNGHGFP